MLGYAKEKSFPIRSVGALCDLATYNANSPVSDLVDEGRPKAYDVDQIRHENAQPRPRSCHP